ncbi:hypothetical protein AB9K89_25310 (plasmid) [Escherichia coli]|uniref:hypothetical protein n=1 Tax=Escherichia coli TaxID=562 RepID=UPI0035268250
MKQSTGMRHYMWRLMTAEYHGVQLHDHEALTYLQGYIAEEFNRSRLQFMADKKAGGLPAIEGIVTRPASTICRGGFSQS